MKRTEFIDSFKRILSQLNKKKYSVIASVCRTLLGMVFIFSGAVKAIDLGLANALLDLDGTVENVFARATYK